MLCRGQDADAVARAHTCDDGEDNVVAALINAGFHRKEVLAAAAAVTAIPIAPSDWFKQQRPVDLDGIDLDLLPKLMLVPIATEDGIVCIAYADPIIAARASALDLPRHYAYLASPTKVARAVRRLLVDAGPTTINQVKSASRENSVLGGKKRKQKRSAARAAAVQKAEGEVMAPPTAEVMAPPTVRAPQTKRVSPAALMASSMPPPEESESKTEQPRAPPTEAPPAKTSQPSWEPTVELPPSPRVELRGRPGQRAEREASGARMESPRAPREASGARMESPRAEREASGARMESPRAPREASGARMESPRAAPVPESSGARMESPRAPEARLESPRAPERAPERAVMRPDSALQLLPAPARAASGAPVDDEGRSYGPLDPPMPSRPARQVASAPAKESARPAPFKETAPVRPAPGRKRARDDDAKPSNGGSRLPLALFALVVIGGGVFALQRTLATKAAPAAAVVTDGGLDLNARQRDLFERAKTADATNAVNFLTNAINLDPASPTARDAFLARAKRYLAAGEHERARRDLVRVQKFPNNDADTRVEVEGLLSDLEKAHGAGGTDVAPR